MALRLLALISWPIIMTVTATSTRGNLTASLSLLIAMGVWIGVIVWPYMTRYCPDFIQDLSGVFVMRMGLCLLLISSISVGSIVAIGDTAVSRYRKQQADGSSEKDKKRRELAAIEFADKKTDYVRRIDKITDLVGAGQLEEARSALSQLDQDLGPLFASRIAATAEVQGLMRRLRRARETLERKSFEYNRRKTVLEGLEEAMALVRDRQQCKSAARVAGAWRKLKQVRRTDPEHPGARRVVRHLETCRQRASELLALGIRDSMLHERKSVTQQMSKMFKRYGMVGTAILQGRRKDELWLVSKMLNEKTAQQFTQRGSRAEGSLLRSLEQSGFKKVTFADGKGTEITYDLDPRGEFSAVRGTLAQFNLAVPLRLP